MSKTAFIFPGQGSQYRSMGKDLYDCFERARFVFDTANDVLGRDIKSLCFEGTDEELKQTVNTQPCILAVEIALFEALGIMPDFVAGHSLGEYAALYAAGVLELDDVFSLIQKRAELMSEHETGSMAAVIGAPEGSIEKCIGEVNDYLTVANYNAPSQTVISGSDLAIAQAGEILTRLKAKRVIPLAVSGAFHSEFMKDAGEKFSDFLENFEINDAEIPVVTNVDAQISTKGFKEKMPKQIYSSVLWYQGIQTLISEGVSTFVEIGPGKVLAGLNKKIDDTISTYNIFDAESLKAVKEQLCQKKD